MVSRDTRTGILRFIGPKPPFPTNVHTPRARARATQGGQNAGTCGGLKMDGLVCCGAPGALFEGFRPRLRRRFCRSRRDLAIGVVGNPTFPIRTQGGAFRKPLLSPEVEPSCSDREKEKTLRKAYPTVAEGGKVSTCDLGSQEVGDKSQQSN